MLDGAFYSQFEIEGVLITVNRLGPGPDEMTCEILTTSTEAASITGNSRGVPPVGCSAALAPAGGAHALRARARTRPASSPPRPSPARSRGPPKRGASSKSCPTSVMPCGRLLLLKPVRITRAGWPV